MRGLRLTAYVVGISIVLGLLAAVVSADTVICRPLIRKDRVVGVCFIVCNTPEERCADDGCIWDVHFLLPGEQCAFTRIIAVPKYWRAAMVPGRPSPIIAASTMSGGQQPANPIGLGRCYRFCFGITCTEGAETLPVIWITTGENGEVLDAGRTKCLLTPPG